VRLRTALNVALARGHMVRNVAELVELPRSTRQRVEPPRADSLRKLLEATRGDRLQALILVALGLGLRRGEAIGLRWEDIDLDARRLVVRRHVVRTRSGGRMVREGAKTSSGERTIILPRIIVRALLRHQAQQKEDRLRAGQHWNGPSDTSGVSTGYVFTSTVGTVMEPRAVNAYFDGACQRAGIDKRTFHGLRHDFGSLLLALGVPTRVVQEMLGHASPYMTMGLYQHVPDELQLDAADRLDRVLASVAAE
jgi:integrase